MMILQSVETISALYFIANIKSTNVYIYGHSKTVLLARLLEYKNEYLINVEELY